MGDEIFQLSCLRYDQFDFLIDIVPRDDVKPVSGGQVSAPAATAATGATTAASGFFLQNPQQQGAQATAQPQVQVSTDFNVLYRTTFLTV